MPGTNPNAIERAIFAGQSIESRVDALEVSVDTLITLTVATQAFTGVTGTVSADYNPFTSWTPIVFKNGIIQKPGTDWTRSGKVFTFIPALAGDDIQICYAYVL